MKVLYISDSTDQGLSFQNEYEVIGLEAGWYRIINDENLPYLYEPKNFHLIDESKPSFWISRLGEDGELYSYPESWLREGFFEDFHDGVQEAVDKFWSEYSKLFS